MTIELHQLPSPRHRRKRRVGRGAGSGRGTYAGRGLKGQRSRTGGRKGLKVRGVKQFMMQLPKRRGFVSHYPKLFPINLSDIAKHFKEGERVNEKQLRAKGLCPKHGVGVKILGKGSPNKKWVVEATAFSASAKNAILNAGGSIVVKAREAKEVRAKKSSHAPSAASKASASKTPAHSSS